MTIGIGCTVQDKFSICRQELILSDSAFRLRTTIQGVKALADVRKRFGLVIEKIFQSSEKFPIAHDPTSMAAVSHSPEVVQHGKGKSGVHGKG